MTKPVILTGLRANSEFHIGNYLGGILPVIELQNKHAGEYQINMFIPDLHSFTTPVDHTKLHQQIINNLKVFVAAGLDISNTDTYIYRQSHISAHSELTWILECFTGYGELRRMTQFKEKRANFTIQWDEIEKDMRTGRYSSELNEYMDQKEKEHKDNVSVGLFSYPVLMAADILLYGAKYIPVGDDQRQHIELTRDLAIRLNNRFKQVLFIVPDDWNNQLEFSNRNTGVRIRSLRNPDKKMSKSINDPSGTILLTDNPFEAAKKIMRAETDSYGVIKFDLTERPGISNLLQMLALLSGKPIEEVCEEWEGKDRYGDLKKAVADATEVFLMDFQAKLQEVNDQKLLIKLEQDETKMRKVANHTLYNVQKAVGLRT